MIIELSLNYIDSSATGVCFFFQAEDGIRDIGVTGFRRVLFRSGRVLTLQSEGPGMDGEGITATYKDVIEIKDDDNRTMTSHVLGDDGNWRQFMTMHFRRTG